MFRLRLLGSLDLERLDGAPVLSVVAQPKRIALLAYLAAGRGRQHSREELIGVFWPESGRDEARNALRQTLHRLRRSLAEGVIISQGDREVEIDCDLLECDVVDFEKSVASGDLERALELYRGDLTEDLHVGGCPEFDHWRDQRAATLRNSAVEAAATLSARMEREGDLPAAVEFVRRAVELAPFDESHVQALMRLSASDGDRAGAVVAYKAFEARLRSELELEPSAETSSLLREIRDTPDAPSVSVDVSGGPYADAPSTDRSQLAATASSSAIASRRWGIGLVAVAVLLSVATVVVVMGRGGGAAATGTEPPRLVVLPFENLSGPEDDYFADGMTEEITSKLTGFSGIRVIARQTAIQYKGSPLSAREIASELNVDYVIEGTVRTDRAPDGSGQVRITPQLIRGSDETHLWAEAFTVALVAGEIFDVQAEIATRIAEGMAVVLPASERAYVALGATDSQEAYDYYLRGMTYYERRMRRLEDYTMAAELFERAVATDPDFVEAHAMRLRTYSFLAGGNGFGRADAEPKAEAAAELLNGLAPDHPATHMALGDYQHGVAGRLDLAEQHLQLARRARPHDVAILRQLARTLFALDRQDESNAVLEEIIAVDPVAGLGRLARNLLEMGRYAEAEEIFDRAISLQPDNPAHYFWKVMLYLSWDGSTERADAVVDAAAGRADLLGLALVTWDFDDEMLLRIFADHFDDAIERRTLDEPGDSVAYYFAKGDAAGRNLKPIASEAYYDSARVVLERRLGSGENLGRTTRNLALAYARLGNVDDARRIAAEVTARDILAETYMLIGDHEDAVHVLEQMRAEDRFSGPILRLDPLWEPLRDHPRFQALAREGN